MQEDELLRLVTTTVLKELQAQGQLQTLATANSAGEKTVPVALSNRHIHLSEEHLAKLFGAGYTLTKLKDLSQPGQFAAKETVRLIGPKGILEGVRILGPARGSTQVELSLGDGFALGVTPPVRLSGDLKDTPGLVVAGPKGVLELTYGVICAMRHIHMSTTDGARFGVRDQEIVRVKTSGMRSLVFDQVIVRVHPDFRLEMHLDLEEGNAAGLKNEDQVLILK